MRLGALLLLATGCDLVLGLERPVTDAAGDAATDSAIDAEADAAPGCWTTLRQDHDEDADGRMDGCDNCPHVPNLDQSDDDMDNVGNLCDPDSTDPNHRIAFYRSFHEVSELAGMMATGNWEIVGDRVVQPDTMGTAQLVAMTRFQDATVMTAVGAPSTAITMASEVGVAAAIGEDAGELRCYLREDLGGNTSVLLERIGANVDTATAANTFTARNTIELRSVDMASTNPRCIADTNDDADIKIDGLGPRGGAAGLFTTTSAGQFDYLIVITREP